MTKLFNTIVLALLCCLSQLKTTYAQLPTHGTPIPVMNYKTVKINGLSIFYREAGNPDNPVIMFLHGFPSSSHMYRDVMSRLASKYRVIAPDYPGFGQSSAPSVKQYSYTFDNLSNTIDQFIDALNLTKITLYMQDYGGPVGFRIAKRRPKLIQGLIIQNANAYNDGLGDLKPFLDYIARPDAENEKSVRKFLEPEATKWQYTDGAGDITKVSPDAYISDQYYLDREGNDQIQLALFRNYGSNFKKYDEWHQYFRKHQPPALVIWGKNDKLFTAAGANAYKRDLQAAEIHLMDGGHFMLEEYSLEAAGLIDKFMDNILGD